MTTLKEIAAYLQKNDDYVLISHTAPDGDTMGSALALALALRSMGKRVQTVCDQSVPHIYSFLPGAEQMKLPEEAKAARIAIAIDCADAERMGGALPLFRAAEHTINIDHHMTNTAYADMNHTGVDIAAAGEHIYELALLLPTELSKDIATCLYTALVTDTGNFSYANTRPHTLIAAAELLARGADNNDINRRVYRSVPLHKQKLLGLAITKAEFLFGGKLGITEISLADMASCGALEEDTEGIIDHIRDVEGDEVAIFIRESAINTYKVSLRSKKYADVGAIAASMGGGGHRQASGYTAHGSLQEVREAVLEKAVLAIGENDTSK